MTIVICTAIPEGIVLAANSAANVGLGMTALLTAGLYSQTATVCNSVTWNWTTATVIRDYGGNFNHCVP